MGDEDLCECIMSQELYMRRLLNLIRNGQSYCTDTECLDFVRSPPEIIIGPANLFLVTCVMVLALTYLTLRTINRRTIFNLKDDDLDSDEESDGDDFEDPPPGPLVN